jgi:plasmid rolling circle replication initiator protein Rep
MFIERNNFNTELEVLQDIKHGKEIPWREKKLKSTYYAEILKTEGDYKKAERALSCGCILTFRIINNTGEKRLVGARFCRERLCPMCVWRRSLKCFHQVSQIMNHIEKEFPDITPVFITLTVKNCKGEELKDVLDNIFKGWHRLFCVRKVNRVIKGWFRALEVTYNHKKDTFHPHLHAIFLVDKQYFRCNEYIKIEEWVKLWRRSARLDYDPICDIRKVKINDGNYKAISEIAKYTVKYTDYLPNDNVLAQRLVRMLNVTLRGRRLLAFGGLMKVIAKKMQLNDMVDDDLIDTDIEEIREDISDIIVSYYWSVGLTNYVRK